jgi:hypothetical protein
LLYFGLFPHLRWVFNRFPREAACVRAPAPIAYKGSSAQRRICQLLYVRSWFTKLRQGRIALLMMLNTIEVLEN